MSETIKGSKSFLYNQQQMGTIPNSADNMQHLSIQEIPGKRGAADVMIHGITVVSTGHTIEAGSAQRVIISNTHGAKQGWFIRPVDGNSSGEEVAIIKIVDADTFVIAALIDIAIGDEFEIIKSVSPNYSADGDLNVVVSGSGPIQFLLDGVATDVQEDTSVPASSIPLPVKNLNSSGITIDPATEQKQDDQIVILDSIDTKTPALVSGRVPVTTDGLTDTQLRATPVPVSMSSSPLPTGAATAANQVTEISSLSSIDTKLSSQATAANQASELTLIGAVTETAPVTDTASSGLNGRLQRIAQRLTSLIALLPASLGQGTMAQSLKVVIASDQSAVPISNTSITNLDTNIGAKADAVATTDTGTFSLISLTKKIAQNITALGAQLPTLCQLPRHQMQILMLSKRH